MAFGGYYIVFILMRLLAIAVAIMAVWGLFEPHRFFGTRVFAAIGLFMAGQIFLFSLFVHST